MTREPSAAARRPGPVDHRLQHGLERSRRQQGHPLVVQLVRDQRPPLIDAEHHVGQRHPQVVVEHRVDVVVAEQVERAHLDPGRPVALGVLQRDEHDRDALVLLGLLVRAHRQPAPVGVRCERRPELLPVDDQLVTVDVGPGTQVRQVGPRLGFRVADGEMDVALEDLGEEVLLLSVGAVAHDGRPDGVDRERRHRGAGPHRLVEEDELLDGGAGLPAVLRRPPDPGPSVETHLLPHPADVGPHASAGAQLVPDLRRDQLGEVGTELLPERLLFVIQPHVHVLAPPCIGGEATRRSGSAVTPSRH